MVYIVLDMGLHSYAVKMISENRQSYLQLSSDLWYSKLILVGLFVAIIGIIIGVEKMTASQAMIFTLISLEMLTYSLFQFLRCFVQGLQKFREDSLLSVIDRILLIILGGGILWLYMGVNIPLSLFISFHIIAYVLCFVGTAYYFRDSFRFSFHLAHHSRLWEILRKGYPLIIITILMSIYTRIDAVLLARWVSDGIYQCGILAYSHRLIDNAHNALSLLGVFLLPAVASHYRSNTAYVQRIVGYTFFISTFMVIGFVTIGYFASDMLYRVLYHTDDIRTIEVFKIQLWTVLGVGWMYVFGSYLTATGRFFQLIGIVSIGVVLSLVLNTLWIPTMGVLGVAQSSAIVQMTMGVLHLLVAGYYLWKK